MARGLGLVALCAVVAACTPIPSPTLSSPSSSSSDPVGSLPPGAGVSVWITTSDRAQLLAAGAPTAFGRPAPKGLPTISVNPGLRFQTILGLGASLTDSSAWLIADRLNATQHDQLMQSLFSPSQGIGISLLRQPFGATDFTVAGNYSFDDLPAGQADPALAHFSIAHDQAYILPGLRQALALNPALSVIASSWSAPAWMKTSGLMEAGTLIPGATAHYADYLVKAVAAYRAAGVTITALAPQNEPLTTPGTFPGMYASATDEEGFIRDALGPALRRAGLATGILGVDDSWSEVDYAKPLVQDPATAAFVLGTAWHCYHGQPSAMSAVHDLNPAKLVLETECSGGSWQGPADQLQGTVRDGIMASLRNWSSTAVLWNIALDTAGGPTNQGCGTCRGVVTIDQATGQVTYNADYYGLGQFSKFVVPGAVRIDSTAGVSGLSSVAFVNPDGSRVLVVFNEAARAQRFAAAEGGRSFTYQIPARAVATFRWT